MPSDIVVSVLSALLSRKKATRLTPVPLTQHDVPAFSVPEIVAPAAGDLNQTSSAPEPGAAVAVVVVVGVGVTVTVFDTLIDTCEVAVSPCASYATALSTWL